MALPLSAPSAVDRANAQFWDELCGTTLARQIGIRDHSAESLRRFDRAYLDFYPYLLRRVPVDALRGKHVLEVGLGYGTLGQKIVEAGAHYCGLDIAEAPVRMMNERIRMAGAAGEATQGSMLDCPFADASFDCVVSIGCFHHTGDAQRCIDETWRVLKPGGSAYLMLYNRFSYRQWLGWPLQTLRALAVPGRPASESQRAAYDANADGAAAPETEFFSPRALRRMLGHFSRAAIAKENCEDIRVRGRLFVSRKLLLPIVGPLIGLDLYVEAVK
jgi:SAM-dependent methyltransferase